MNPVKGIILDLDGTLCLGEEIIPTAPEAIASLRAMELPIVFLSNTIDTPTQYAARLSRFGINTDPEDILQASSILIRYLKKEMPNAIVFAIGEAPLLEMLAEHFELSEDPGKIDVVVASFDRDFDYRKLTIGFKALKRGARFLATNVDATCPLPEGELPDAGVVVAALETCTGMKLELNVGKPSSLMLEAALDRISLNAADIILVGDRLETDILMGIHAGVRTVLVLTGVTQRADLRQSENQPDVVLESIAELPGWIQSIKNKGGS
jgi:arabinose operon protein AraL